MATPSQSFEQLTVFGRFLRQKNGIANMLMAGFCCALSARLLQQRQEHDERTAAMESAFATERAELKDEIDRLRGRGWFGRGRSRGGGGRPSKGDGAKKGGEGVGADPAREKRNAAANKVMV